MSIEVRRLEPAFQCAACRRAATWMVAGTSTCDLHRSVFVAVAQGRQS